MNDIWGRNAVWGWKKNINIVMCWSIFCRKCDIVAKNIIYKSIIIITRGNFLTLCESGNYSLILTYLHASSIYYSILLVPYSLVINASLYLRRNTLIKYLRYLWYTFAILCTSTGQKCCDSRGRKFFTPEK